MLTLPVKALILANLIPLFGVLFFDWDAGALLLLYWLEGMESFSGFGQEDSLALFLPLVMIQGVLSMIAERYPGLLFLPLLSFIISHGISTVTHHFIGKEDAGRKVASIMFDPYGRIVILHVAILAGGFFVFVGDLASAVPALILLVVMKTALDLFEHQRSHRKRQKTARGDVPSP